MELSALLIPLLFTAAACGGLRRRVNIYAALTDGAAAAWRMCAAWNGQFWPGCGK